MGPWTAVNILVVEEMELSRLCSVTVEEVRPSHELKGTGEKKTLRVGLELSVSKESVSEMFAT